MCFCAVRSSSVSVFAVRSGVSVFVLSARRPGAQPRVKEVWSAAGHFYTATSLYCHHHHHHSVIHVYLLFQASATSRLFQFLAIGWIILVRFPNPLAFGSENVPFVWKDLDKDWWKKFWRGPNLEPLRRQQHCSRTLCGSETQNRFLDSGCQAPATQCPITPPQIYLMPPQMWRYCIRSASGQTGRWYTGAFSCGENCCLCVVASPELAAG